jgi:starch-binding outer membrane protein, SusD/RagB family
MKSKITILFCVIILLGACAPNKDFLAEDPKGQLFPDNFLNNANELSMMNNALYWQFIHAMDRPYQSMEIKLPSSDDILGTGNQRAYYNEMEDNMNISAGGDADIQAGWERCYNAINQANAIIANYHNADGKVVEADLNAYAAQAYFIRAFTYFWLVRFYNNIPLITTAFQPDTKKEITCSKALEVYNLIISDLQFAEEWLPVAWSDNTLRTGGAVTQGAAKSLLSKVYLQMAGFPVNGGTEYYVKARDKAKEVIDNASVYGYALREHFYQVWDPYWQYNTTPDEPILWAEHNIVNDEYSVRAPNPSRPIELGGWESMIAENGFFNRFPSGERKDFTFVTDFYVNGGQHYTYNDLKCKHPCYRKLWADNLSEGWAWENRNDPSSL